MPRNKQALKRARATPKGRRVDPQAREEVLALLGNVPRRRDLLIEHLHLIQDRFGCLSARHLVALAAEMKLAMAEVYEVATFYHHFDVVKEGDDAAARDHRARLRLDRVRHGRLARAAGGVAGRARPGRARPARALRRPLRDGAGRGGRTESGSVRECGEGGGAGSGQRLEAPAAGWRRVASASRHRHSRPHRLRRLSGEGRI